MKIYTFKPTDCFRSNKPTDRDGNYNSQLMFDRIYVDLGGIEIKAELGFIPEINYELTQKGQEQFKQLIHSAPDENQWLLEFMEDDLQWKLSLFPEDDEELFDSTIGPYQQLATILNASKVWALVNFATTDYP